MPAAWQTHFRSGPNTLVTVRIDEEASEDQSESSPLTSHPLFGMWKDRDDIGDAAVYARQLRAARYPFDASPSKE